MCGWGARAGGAGIGWGLVNKRAFWLSSVGALDLGRSFLFAALSTLSYFKHNFSVFLRSSNICNHFASCMYFQLALSSCGFHCFHCLHSLFFSRVAVPPAIKKETASTKQTNLFSPASPFCQLSLHFFWIQLLSPLLSPPRCFVLCSTASVSGSVSQISSMQTREHENIC